MKAGPLSASRQAAESTVASASGGYRPVVDSRVPALTVVAHPDPTRVGERVLLPALTSGRPVPLSRLEPLFSPPGSGAARALADLHLSRQPILLRPAATAGELAIAPADLGRLELIGGAPGLAAGELSRAALENGVCLMLGGRVVLLLHLFPAALGDSAERCGLVGESAAVWRLRAEIERSARLPVPVLLRGESGTGKELAARAIHQLSARRGRPYCALNFGALPPALAAAELFGAARGAFTGADQKRDGYFARADGGTLFLDEIGEAPLELQALLLRAVESGEIHPMGAGSPRQVDVRLIAATDADLETMVAEGRFRAPLLHRLQADQIRLPPLRERRDDIARLLAAFLGKEPAGARQPPARLVARLVMAGWPGNVRELRNVARRLGSALLAEAAISENLADWLGSPPAFPGAVERPAPPPNTAAAGAPAAGGKSRRRYRAIAEIPPCEILAALESCRFGLAPAAAALGVSRQVLDRWVERRPGLRKAAELGREQILEALEACAGDLDAAAGRLAVSRHGLRLRRTALGLP
jgi:two-component system nitrogen regulation response regulator GlnG